MAQSTKQLNYIKWACIVAIGLLVVTVLVKAMQKMTAHNDITIYAAASMTNAVNDINLLYTNRYHTPIKTSFASSATLAKQIEQGAKADIFIAADTTWMDYLQQKNKLNDGTAKNFLSNRLVLIAPKAGNSLAIPMTKTFDISKVLTGKLCTGNTASVPVGKYAKQALINLGWWQAVQPHLVETEDVRSALNFVNRGECQFGIVYATDVAVVNKVKIVAIFPDNTHPPIIYPLAIVKNKLQNSEAERYYEFLQSPAAKAIYKKYGFTVLQ